MANGWVNNNTIYNILLYRTRRNSLDSPRDIEIFLPTKKNIKPYIISVHVIRLVIRRLHKNERLMVFNLYGCSLYNIFSMTSILYCFINAVFDSMYSLYSNTSRATSHTNDCCPFCYPLKYSFLTVSLIYITKKKSFCKAIHKKKIRVPT